jgi:hypothetical protein
MVTRTFRWLPHDTRFSGIGKQKSGLAQAADRLNY